ncbi:MULTISPECIES: hypothetical protein, partial [Cyanophyceae]
SQESGASMNSELRTQNSALTTFLNTPNPKLDSPITEATGWQVTPTGEVLLVASTPDHTVQNRLNQAVTCQGR